MNQLIVIIGKRSNLTESLVKTLGASRSFKVIPTWDVLAGKVDWKLLNNCTFILNNFYPAKYISNINESNLKVTVDYSIRSTSIVLDSIKNFNLKVNKIIYTSSSSVYGDSKQNLSGNDKDSFALLKKLNEIFITSYCCKNNIDYTLARVFNIYGGNDNFSVISKLIKYKSGEIFNLVNGGSSKRDYIHVDDVSYILLKLVNVTNIPVVDIGTGSSLSLCEIIEFLKSNGLPVKVLNTSSYENPVSVANTSTLNFVIGNDYRFKSVFGFLQDNLLN
jgi:nucleoside-diphosphate-sugar epimerase